MGYILVRRDGRLVLESRSGASSFNAGAATKRIGEIRGKAQEKKQEYYDKQPAAAGGGSGGKVLGKLGGLQTGARSLKKDIGANKGSYAAKAGAGVGALGLAGLAAKGIKDKTMSNVDKAKEAAGSLKDVGKDAVDSLPTGAIAGGAAAALGGGLALKKYLKNRKKKAA